MFECLLSYLHLAILSNYLAWCISIILLSSDVESNLGLKSSSREFLSICHWNFNDIFLIGIHARANSHYKARSEKKKNHKKPRYVPEMSDFGR